MDPEPWNIFLKDAVGLKSFFKLKGRQDKDLEGGRDPVEWSLELKIARGWDNVSAKVLYMLPLFFSCSCVPIHDYCWSQMDVWLFCPLYIKYLSFFLWVLGSTFSPSDTVFDYFSLKCFPCMGIHTYGSINFLLLT